MFGGATRPVWIGSHLDTVPQGGQVRRCARRRRGDRGRERPGAARVACSVTRSAAASVAGRCAAAGPLPGCSSSSTSSRAQYSPPRARRSGSSPRSSATRAARSSSRARRPCRARRRWNARRRARRGRGGGPTDAGPGAAIRARSLTVGQIEVEPGGINVVPGRVRFSIDARAPDEERLDRLVAAIGFEPRRAEPLTAMSPGEFGGASRRDRVARATRRGAAVRRGPRRRHPCRAGRPTRMLFVRSLNDGSHSPDELSSPEDVELAIDVLAGALAVSENAIGCAPFQRHARRSTGGARARPPPSRSGCPRAALPCSRSRCRRTGRGSRPRWRRRGRAAARPAPGSSSGPPDRGRRRRSRPSGSSTTAPTSAPGSAATRTGASSGRTQPCAGRAPPRGAR